MVVHFLSHLSASVPKFPISAKKGRKCIILNRKSPLGYQKTQDFIQIHFQKSKICTGTQKKLKAKNFEDQL
jgi:hypothetical protein